jgi:hypothetical protein
MRQWSDMRVQAGWVWGAQFYRQLGHQSEGLWCINAGLLERAQVREHLLHVFVEKIDARL